MSVPHPVLHKDPALVESSTSAPFVEQYGGPANSITGHSARILGKENIDVSHILN